MRFLRLKYFEKREHESIKTAAINNHHEEGMMAYRIKEVCPMGHKRFQSSGLVSPVEQ